MWQNKGLLVYMTKLKLFCVNDKINVFFWYLRNKCLFVTYDKIKAFLQTRMEMNWKFIFNTHIVFTHLLASSVAKTPEIKNKTGRPDTTPHLYVTAFPVVLDRVETWSQLHWFVGFAAPFWLCVFESDAAGGCLTLFLTDLFRLCIGTNSDHTPPTIIKTPEHSAGLQIAAFRITQRFEMVPSASSLMYKTHTLNIANWTSLLIRKSVTTV